MNRGYLALILVLIAAAAGWVLHDDAEARVRKAHQALERVLSKTEEDTGTAAILSVRALQGLFAADCEVSGDADELTGTYSPEEMVSTIVGVQGLFESIDLTFGELAIAFPAADDAITEFTATLIGRGNIEELKEIMEVRRVTSRMRKIDGSWLFSEFRLEAVRQ